MTKQGFPENAREAVALLRPAQLQLVEFSCASDSLHLAFLLLIYQASRKAHITPREKEKEIRTTRQMAQMLHFWRDQVSPLSLR